MSLIRLVYSSIKRDEVTPESITNILTVARAENQKQNITGMLCFNRNYFLQVLEGERERVCELFNKISNDKRHKKIVIYQFVEVSNREFERWSMGYIPESSLTSSIILKYSNGTEFNPSEMSSESILRMMLTLKDIIPTK